MAQLPMLAKTLLALHNSADNLLTLHGVTSMQALRLVLPYIDNPTRAISYYTHAILALYVALEMPDIEPIIYHPVDDLLSWCEIQAQAIQSNNDHTIKLVYSCLQEHETYADMDYQFMATKTLMPLMHSRVSA